MEIKQYTPKQAVDQREIKKYLETIREPQPSKTYGSYKNSSRREVYCDKPLHQESRSQMSDPTLHIKKLEKEEQTKKLIGGRK